MKSRWRWALALSLAFHLTVVLVTLYHRNPAPLPGKSTLDTTVEVADQPTQMAFPETPTRKVQLPPQPEVTPSAIQQVAHQEPAIPEDNGIRQANAVGSANGSSTPAATPSQSGSSSTVQPLHRPIPAGKSLVYLVDRSGSMRHGHRLEMAIASVVQSLARVGPDARFQVVLYDSVAEAIADPGERPIVGTELNHRRAKDFLRDQIPQGRSNHRAGLQKAIGFNPDVIVWLTDEDTIDRGLADDFGRWNKGTRLFLGVVGNGPMPGETGYLQRMIEATGGQVFAIAPVNRAN